MESFLQKNIIYTNLFFFLSTTFLRGQASSLLTFPTYFVKKLLCDMSQFD